MLLQRVRTVPRVGTVPQVGMWRRILVSVGATPLVGLALLATGFGPSALAVVYLAAITPWLVGFDIREHRLPNVLVLPGIVVGLLSCAGEWLESGRVPAVPLIAAAAYAGFLFILSLAGGMGMGDVKLAAALGLASWTLSVAGLSPVLAFFAGGFVSVVLLVAGHRGRRIAFGPFLLGGFWASVALVALSRV